MEDSWGGDQAGDRGVIDDGAAAVFAHLRDLVFHAQPHALEIRIH